MVSYTRAKPLMDNILTNQVNPRNVSIPLAALNEAANAVHMLESLQKITQQAVSLQIDLNLKGKIVSATQSTRDKARLNSVSLQHAGDWLNVFPSKVMGLHLASQEFQAAARYRLGIPNFPNPGNCVACD
jgi:Mg/Co/Ni transporter MgtE